jgi:hypothetical protein
VQASSNLVMGHGGVSGFLSGWDTLFWDDSVLVSFYFADQEPIGDLCAELLMQAKPSTSIKRSG